MPRLYFQGQAEIGTSKKSTRTAFEYIQLVRMGKKSIKFGLVYFVSLCLFKHSKFTGEEE